MRNRCEKFRSNFFLVAMAVFAAALPAAGAVPPDVNLMTAIQDIAKRTIPAVVHVEVREKKKVVNPLLPFQDDPLFKHFFGDPEMPKKFERLVIGLGSGIVLDSKGHILTNGHVVNGALKTAVVLSDGRRYTDSGVKLIGVDPKTDLAVIRIIDGKGLVFADFGDSDQIEVGQWVVAIGHPQGLDQTVTQGIISAKHRRGVADPTSYQDFLQTDAAINPGNSGGPLLNLRGEVIGVNAAIVSRTGGFEGIGFAIPANLALYVANQLIASGKVVRGWIGITIENLTPELAAAAGLVGIKGAVVANVLKDGPAELAGLKPGDIIIEHEGKEIDNPGSFRNRVAASSVGEPVNLTLWRDGKRHHVGITAAGGEEHEKALLSSVRERFGVEVRPVAKTEVEQYDLEANKGVAVSRIVPKSIFENAGIEAGDIILQIDQLDVDGLSEFGAIVSIAPAGKKLTLAILDHRTGKTSLAPVKVP